MILFPPLIFPPTTLSKSFFFHLVISYLFFLSYNSLNLFTPLLIFACLPLIVWLWVGVIFVSVGLFPRLFGLVLAAPVEQYTKHCGWCDSQSASWREEPTEELLTTTKTLLQPQSLHKWHKGHPRASGQ